MVHQNTLKVYYTRINRDVTAMESMFCMAARYVWLELRYVSIVRPLAIIVLAFGHANVTLLIR